MSWAPPATLPNLAGDFPLVVDLETCDPDLKEHGPGWPWGNGFIAGIAVGPLEPGSPQWYLPIQHGDGNLNPRDTVLNWACDTFRGRTIIGHNLLYDAGWGYTVNLFEGCTFRDTLFGAVLLDEERQSYSLDALGRELLGVGKDETLLHEGVRSLGAKPKQAKSLLWKMHSRYVGPYAEGDVRLTRDLYHWQQPRLEADELLPLYELECDLIPILTAMRARGVRVDVAAAERLYYELVETEGRLRDEISSAHGVSLAGPRHTAGIVQACTNLGIEFQRIGADRRPSFTAAWMQHHAHPFVQTLRQYREVNTIRTLCVEGIILDHEQGGRVYPELHPLKRDRDANNEGRGTAGAATGRFIASHPNVLQTSVRTELGARVRELFLPEEGERWCSLDYSQQEPRLLVHFAALLGMPMASAAARKFTEEGADFHQLVADLVGIPRKVAKPINLGLIYGMGVAKLCGQLGLDEAAGRPIITRYHEAIPFVRSMNRLCTDVANRRGYVRTLLKRRRRFSLWEPYRQHRRERVAPLPLAEAKRVWPGVELTRGWTYKALNAVIQGSAADQTKQALVNLWRAGHRGIMLPVHDEFDLSIGSDTEAAAAATVMQDAVQLGVPSVVDVGVGANWREAKA
jgi:DNA polymerase I-like protein with 3'-5' exonuclease and polymerase domains